MLLYCSGTLIIYFLCLVCVIITLSDEWVPIAAKLAEHSYVTVLVYTHLTRKPLSDMLTLLHQIVLTDTLHASRVIVMGKSAGGGLAQEFALKFPHNLLALVLAAPASSQPEHILSFCSPAPVISSPEHTHSHTPLFLAWAVDDPSYAKSRLWLNTCREDDTSFLFYSAKQGGHRILPEYEVPILNFLQTHHITSSKHV
jgi:pimeloyl-ACP methyl ester carboxylesterase